MATYEMKPRLNTLLGRRFGRVALVQGGQEPEFHIVPRSAKYGSRHYRERHLGRGAQNQSCRPLPDCWERNTQLYLGCVNGQVAHARGKSPTQSFQKHCPPEFPVRVGDICGKSRPPWKPVYTVCDGERKAGGLAQHQSASPTATPYKVAQEVHGRDRAHSASRSPPGNPDFSLSNDQSIIVGESIQKRARCDSDRNHFLRVHHPPSYSCADLGERRWWRPGSFPSPSWSRSSPLKADWAETFDLMTLGRTGCAARRAWVPSTDANRRGWKTFVLHREPLDQGRQEAIRSALKKSLFPLIGSTDYASRCLRSAEIVITGLTGVSSFPCTRCDP